MQEKVYSEGEKKAWLIKGLGEENELKWKCSQAGKSVAVAERQQSGSIAAGQQNICATISDGIQNNAIWRTPTFGMRNC